MQQKQNSGHQDNCDTTCGVSDISNSRVDGLPVLHLVENEPHAKANAAVLAGAYAVLFAQLQPDAVYSSLAKLKPFAHFRDASTGVAMYHITVLDCIRGIFSATNAGFITFHTSTPLISLEEHAHYEQLEHGDLSWIVPGKAVAFSGPLDQKTKINGFKTLVPEDYVGYFKRKGVTAIVRLNNKVYDRRRWTSVGLRCYELFFADGTTPPESILRRFLEIMEREPGAVAVHCKAGLGRTGTLLACYLMRNYGFTANEAIGYVRICRPGSVIGVQQRYLREAEAFLWSSTAHLPGKPISRSRPASTDNESSTRPGTSNRAVDNAKDDATEVPDQPHVNEQQRWEVGSGISYAAASSSQQENSTKVNEGATSPTKWRKHPSTRNGTSTAGTRDYLGSSRRNQRHDARDDRAQLSASSVRKHGDIRAMSTPDISPSIHGRNRRVIPGGPLPAKTTMNQQQQHLASSTRIASGEKNGSASQAKSTKQHRSGATQQVIDALHGTSLSK